ncbi:MAG: hypothetical protein M3Y70_00660 [Pseudomonadota bacterium]|nr:hypothetical protein [Pseudomonadota bacterium]
MAARPGSILRPSLWGTGAWPWVLLLLAVAVLGFWKPYFSRLTTAQGLAHVHTAAMLAWIGMLVAQPVLVHRRQLAWHRLLGKASYVVAPLIVVTALMLAQLRISQVPPEMLPLQRTIMYLGVSASAMFLLMWGLGIRHRRDSVVHARYMVGTALLLIDPSLARVMIHWIPAVPPPLYQWISFGVVYLALGALIAFDRVPRGRRTLQVVLVLMVALHVSILLVPGTTAWQRFAEWFAALS